VVQFFRRWNSVSLPRQLSLKFAPGSIDWEVAKGGISPSAAPGFERIREAVLAATSAVKQGAREAFNAVEAQLTELSHRIHAYPELGFEEERASAWLEETLADAGFAVEAGVFDIPTAFVARRGRGPLHVAICAEYDALPSIGHACGHNVIAASALGAAMTPPASRTMWG
jgi:hypothetical protein